ncbi:MAG: hypothetical protein V1664_05245 [Candidatus Uhrbacteria bacterium]
MPPDSSFADWMFMEQNPDCVGPKEKEQKNREWDGYDSGFEIFPHLNLDWEKVKKYLTKQKNQLLI